MRLVAAVCLLAGCFDSPARCGDGTLLVQVTLDAAAGDADELSIDIAVDNGGRVMQRLALAGGAASGTIVVTFPHGYPVGRTVTVDVTALRAGATVGSGQASKLAGPGCDVLAIAVTGTAGDGSALRDLAGADFAGADFALPPPLDCSADGGATSCVPAAPPGWNGPFVLYNGPPSGAPTCGGATPTQVLAGFGTPTYQPATCSSCSCTGSPSGAGCSYGTVYVYDSTNGVGTCVGAGQLFVALSKTCVAASTYPNGSVIDPYWYGSGGTCPTPPPPTPTVPPYSWTSVAVGCAPPTASGLGCGPSSVCMPRPSAPFRDNVYCISPAAEGPATCPAGPYATTYAFYAGATDSRACSACACKPQTTCTTTYSGYSDSGCVTVLPSLDNRAIPSMHIPSCAVTFNGSSTPASFKITSEMVSSTCALDPTGGQPIGNVTPIQPITFCCTQ
jgi:hypothetical protein